MDLVSKAQTILMRDVLSCVHSRSSESGYIDARELLADLRALADEHKIPVESSASQLAQRNRRSKEKQT